MKFRIWDKISKTYLQELKPYYWHVPRSLNNEEIEGEANLIGLSELLINKDFKVERAIGRKDIKGNEVFEGDITNYRNPFGGYELIKYEGNIGNHSVGMCYGFYISDRVEIIGNKNQNPEIKTGYL